MFVRRLRWDPGNVAHISNHGVTVADVEHVCRGSVLAEQGYEGRLRLLGPNASGRTLAVVLAPEGRGVYYVITARPASRKERQRYSEWLEGQAND